MYLFPLYLTFSGFFVAFFFGKYIGILGACAITTFFVFLSMLVSFFMFYEVALLNTPCYFQLFKWIRVDLMEINWGFQYDSLTVTMLVVITVISFLAHLYSIEYMNGDPHHVRFMSYLSLFTFFMLILVTSDNLFQLFMGWEGVGVCSYLLINFWFTRISANKSAIMAIITNKVGDIALLIAFTIIYYLFRSFEYSTIFAIITANSFNFSIDICILESLSETYQSFLTVITDFVGAYYLTENALRIDSMIYYTKIVCVLFIIGAVAKSAQVGLHVWLPEAMEGPTPVSSLIHAATMVTAGIFLIIRCSFMFEYVPSTLLWVIMLGSITSFFASTVGVFQNDLKKVVAYSTCSQLGYMFMSCGFSSYSNSIFHLFNHAFFKALLFLTAGYVIHAFSNEQDMRKMGGLLKLLPVSYLMILIGSLALMGFPFLSGFYSKEKILEVFYTRYSLSFFDVENNLQIIYFFQLLASVAVIFTICYSMRLLLLTYFNTQNGYLSRMYYILLDRKNNYAFIYNIHYASVFILTALFILSYLSLVSGYVFSDMMIGVGTDFWGNALYVSPSFENTEFILGNSDWVLFNYEFNKYIRRITMVWSFYFMIFFFILFFAFKTFLLNIKLGSISSLNIFHILTEKYIFYNRLLVEPIMGIGLRFALKSTYMLLDKGIIEIFGPFGIVQVIRNWVFNYNKYQTGFISHYLNFILIGLLLLILCILM
jgi:NADH-ubiquinone oxidoreductase chain 5